MPKRSNQFQKLIFLVKRHAAAGASVTESKMLPDLVTGTEREVDICVQSTIAGHAVTLSLECNAKGRKASVGWVEEMKAKHDRLPTSALVLVSRAGFSREAATVARTYGIQTLALNSVTAPVAKRLFGNAGTLWSKTFTLNPTKVILEVPATEQLASEKVATFPDNLVYNSNGTELGTVKDLVATLLRADFTLREFGKRGDSTHKYFVLEWTPPRDEEHCLCLKKLDPDILRRIELVRVTGECNFDISEFRLNHGDLGGVTIAWGTGAFLGKKALLVASEVEGAGVALSITTDDK